MFSISQAAEKLGLSPASVRRLCDSGRLPSFRPMGGNGHRRIRPSDLDSFLEQCLPETLDIRKDEFRDLAGTIAKAKKASRK